MKYKCIICRKKNKSGACLYCGLYDKNYKLDINNSLMIINELIFSHNKKIKYYKLDNTNIDNITFYPNGILLLFDWIYDEWIDLSLPAIQALRFLLSYLVNIRNLNISEYATIFFGYMAIYNSEFVKYYEFWKKKAIKTGSYLAIKWAIVDLEIEGKNTSKLRNQLCKLSHYPKKC